MKAVVTICLVIIITIFAVTVHADSDFFKQFKDNYLEIGSELSSKPPAEIAVIKDFTYQKDIAKFTFISGKIFLLREIEGRPTTAIFIGEGVASIEIPNHLEQSSLEYASGKRSVKDSFEVAFINFSDDFDLRLKSKFTFEQSVLSWRNFNRAQQGEFFFKPTVMHEYDNYFQLLRSVYERKSDGYFWIDFNRYVYSFDPNRPEEVVVAYEKEGGDIDITYGAMMQRQENNIYEDGMMSDIKYPTEVISRKASFIMAGLDGKKIKKGIVDFALKINEDSLKFVTIFLNRHFTIDSILLDNTQLAYHRRGDFTVLGMILPEYRYQGDTLNLHLFYRGAKYYPALPFVENPKPSPHNLIIDAPKGFNYCMPSLEILESKSSKRSRFFSAPEDPYRIFMFQPLVSDYDTIEVISDIGITLSFLESDHISKKYYDDFIPHELYRPIVTETFNYLAGKLGSPISTFAIDIFPGSGVSMPGLVEIPQVQQLIDGTGGLPMVAGNALSRQWFGALMQPKTDREYWLMDAMPDYLSLMSVWNGINPSVFFGELGSRRNFIRTLIDNDRDQPLATGKRIDPLNSSFKGSWLIHMLRFLMYDLESHSENKFFKFINELKIVTNSAPYTNSDIIQIAEKHYGSSLGYFFHHWLYDRNIPKYDVKYNIESRSDGNYVVATVDTKGVSANFQMPIIMRVESENGESVYTRNLIKGLQDNFELGPYSFMPKELIFNEFYSVLSEDHVRKEQ